MIIQPADGYEKPWGGSFEAEQILLRRLATEIVGVWQASLDQATSTKGWRMMHAKTVAAADRASLQIDRLVPAELAVGHFHPGDSLPLLLRMSNASHIPQPDGAPDIRGLDIRLLLAGGAVHDLLFVNAPSAIVRDAGQFHAYFMASRLDRDQLLAKLVVRLGEREVAKIARKLKASFRLCNSLACECFWSCGALLWGDKPVKLKLIPLSAGPPDRLPKGDDGLRVEWASRLAEGDIRFRLALQEYVNDTDTPIEGESVEWNERIAPPVEIATLVIPREDRSDLDAEAVRNEVEQLDWNPWKAPSPFRALGSLNRLRRFLYPLATGAPPQTSGTSPPDGPTDT